MAHQLPIIGIVGGIGSGKSAVARLMAEMGAAVIDADALAKSALQSEPVRRQLVEWWGERVLDEKGGVNRRAVADIVFADEPQRKRLEGLIHPIVAEQRDREIERLEATATAKAEAEAEPEAKTNTKTGAGGGEKPVRAIVLDVPLLMEVGLDERCDHVVFVDCDRATRLKRLAESRGWGAEELDRREKNQLSIDRKLQRATDIVDNTKGESALHRQIRDLLDRILNPR